MKTLILYATKYGAAREIAERIGKLIDGAVVHDLKKGEIPSAEEFECVIVGSSVYAGTIHKEAKAFLSQHENVLKDRRLGLFLSGMDASKEAEVFAANFTPSVLESAKVKSFLGGMFDPKKAGFLERAVMKAVAKQSIYMDNIDDGKIKQFAEVMQA